MPALQCQKTDNGILLKVKVIPGSSKTAMAGLIDGMLKVKIAAPPEKGKANKCLTDFLAKKLGVRKNDILITSGRTATIKSLQISNIEPEQLIEKLDLHN